MQRLQQMFANVTAQLEGLSPSSKGLIASIVVILGLLLGYVLMLSAQPDLVPLGLSASVDDSRRAAIVSYLQGRGIRNETRGSDIAVPADRQLAVIDQLRRQELIDADGIDFSSFIANDSVFTAQGSKDRHYLIAKMQVLEAMIARLDSVESSKVIIDPRPRGGGIGKAAVPASASVTVRAGSAGLSRSDAEYIAKLVAHSHAGLSAPDVAITDERSGRTYTGVASKGGFDGGSRLEYQQAVEQAVREKIQESLQFVPGAMVSVNAQVDFDTIQRASTRPGDPKSGVTREQSSERSSTRRQPSGQPGVRSNTAVSVASASPGFESSESTSDTSIAPVFPVDQEVTQITPGRVREINAVVQIPRSWIVGVWQSRQPDPTVQPDDATIDAFAQTELASIRQNVGLLVDTEIDGSEAASGAIGRTNVSMYADGVMLGMVNPGADAGAAGFVGDLVSGGFVGTASLAVLAIISLALMLMVVKNASREEPLPSPEELVGIPPALSSDDEDIIGEVGDAEIALEGREIDDNVVRREQILEYLNSFANEDPEDAALLLRRWLREDAA